MTVTPDQASQLCGRGGQHHRASGCALRRRNVWRTSLSARSLSVVRSAQPQLGQKQHGTPKTARDTQTFARSMSECPQLRPPGCARVVPPGLCPCVGRLAANVDKSGLATASHLVSGSVGGLGQVRDVEWVAQFRGGARRSGTQPPQAGEIGRTALARNISDRVPVSSQAGNGYFTSTTTLPLARPVSR